MRIWSNLLLTSALAAFVGAATAAVRSQAPSSDYVGSQSCQRCHAPTYERWSKTRMANVVRDPKAASRGGPAGLLEAGSAPDVHAGRRRVRRTAASGSSATSRRSATTTIRCRAQWDVTHRVWRPYFVQPNTDWWVPHYPADNMKRPTGPLCDGCHSVNYDVQTKTVTEWNVGCERCHGPGSDHVRQPTRAQHRQPGEARFRARQRHVHPVPLAGPAADQSDRRASTTTGRSVSIRAAGSATSGSSKSTRSARRSFTHFADGTAHKNRMQGNDFVQSLMYKRGVTCFSCHDVHGTPQQRRSDQAGARPLSDLPRADVAQRPARGDHRTAHAPCAGQRRQRLRRLPHAADRADDRGRQRAQPHLPVHHAGRERTPQGAESLRRLSQGQDQRVGDGAIAAMAGDLALAGWSVEKTCREAKCASRRLGGTFVATQNGSRAERAHLQSKLGATVVSLPATSASGRTLRCGTCAENGL